MMNILLLVHVIVAVLLTIVILMQKTGATGISGIGGGGNTGIVSSRTAASFLTYVTITLAAVFMINALVLANLSSKKVSNIEKKLMEATPVDSNNIPIAK